MIVRLWHRNSQSCERIIAGTEI